MKRPENQRLRLLLGAQVFLGVAGIAGFFFFRRRGRQACAMKILAATNWTAFSALGRRLQGALGELARDGRGRIFSATKVRTNTGARYQIVFERSVA